MSRKRPEPLQIKNVDGSVAWVCRDGHVDHSAARFGLGNLGALRGGIWTAVVTREVAIRAFSDLAEAYPWILEADEAAVEQLCEQKALNLMATEYAQAITTEHGFGDVPEKVLKTIDSSHRAVVHLLEDLAMVPTTRTKMLRDQGNVVQLQREELRNLKDEGHAMRVAQGLADE